MDKKLVITIEREYGSGGRLLGKELSEELGIPYYDDDIIKTASEKSAVAEEYVRMNDEKPGRSLLGSARRILDRPSFDSNVTKPENLFKLEAEAIRQLAEEGPCILIGRCSDFVLETAGNIEYVSLFVYCDLAQKIRRVIEVDGVDTDEAVRRIQKINRQRRDYCRYYTGNNWGDVQLYDLPINTTDITVPQAAELVKLYLKLRGYNI